MVKQLPLTIVVPHQNRPNHLAQCLKALAHQSYRRDQYEIIVVDDGSGGEEKEQARKISTHGARFFENPNKPLSAARARNAGLSAARGEWTLFLDCDCIAPPELLHNIMGCPRMAERVDLVPTQGSSLSDQVYEFVSGTAKWEEMQREPLLRDLRWEFADSVSGEFRDHPAPWVFAWTTGLLAATRLIRDVGGFDGQLDGKGSEDIAFGYALSQAGATFRLLPIPPLIHIPHLRDRKAEERRERVHERQFLGTHPRFEVEMLCAFDAANTGEAIRRLEWLCERPIEAWPERIAHPISNRTGPVCLLGGASERLQNIFQPDYCLDPAFRGNESKHRYSLIGLALPFADKELEWMVIPDLRDLLPEGLICRIFQEATRGSRHVLYLKRARAAAPPVLREAAARGFDHPYWERTFYISRSYYDWQLLGFSESDEVVTSEVIAAPGARWTK